MKMIFEIYFFEKKNDFYNIKSLTINIYVNGCQ